MIASSRLGTSTHDRHDVQDAARRAQRGVCGTQHHDDGPPVVPRLRAAGAPPRLDRGRSRSASRQPRRMTPMPRPWLLVACVLGLLAEPPAPPATPKKPASDTYHGVTVTEDYRWLEDAADPAVKQWTEAQNRVARAVLDASPALPELRKRLKELLGTPQTRTFALHQAGGQLFALKKQPPKEQPFLVVMKSVADADSARVVLDPNTLDPSGKTSIDFFVPSRDGKLVAVVMSQGGSEEGTAH